MTSTLGNRMVAGDGDEDDDDCAVSGDWACFEDVEVEAAVAPAAEDVRFGKAHSMDKCIVRDLQGKSTKMGGMSLQP